MVDPGGSSGIARPLREILLCWYMFTSSYGGMVVVPRFTLLNSSELIEKIY